MTDRRDFILNEIRPSELVELINTQIEANSPHEGTTPDYTLMGELIWALILNQGPQEAFSALYCAWAQDFPKDAPTVKDALINYGLMQKMGDALD